MQPQAMESRETTGSQATPQLNLPAAPLPVRTALECYQILEILGQGGFGISYRAYDARLRREVVLKEHFPQGICYRNPGEAEVYPTEVAVYRRSLEVFQREAQLLAGIKHEGVISVHEVFHACGTAYMVLEYAEGYTLAQRTQTAPFSSEELRSILRKLLHTLGYLHELGILHRDIKPANIILQEGLNPVLIDFGAALTEIPEHTITTVGSQAFSAPEQFNNHRKLGPWSDLYALGNTLLYLMSDEAANDTQLLQTLRKAVEYRPEDRWQNAAEWLAALDTRPSAEEPAPRKRRLWLPIILIAGLIPAAVCGYMLIPPTAPEPAPPSVAPAPPTPAANTQTSEENHTPTMADAPSAAEDESAPESDEALTLSSQTEEATASTATTADKARPSLHSQMHPELQKELYERELSDKTKDLTAQYQLKRLELAGKAMSGYINEAQKATELQELHRQYVENYNAISRDLAQKYALEPIVIQ